MVRGGGGAALESETGNLTCSSAGAVREGRRAAPLTAVATRCVDTAEIQDWRQRCGCTSAGICRVEDSLHGNRELDMSPGKGMVLWCDSLWAVPLTFFFRAERDVCWSELHTGGTKKKSRKMARNHPRVV